MRAMLIFALSFPAFAAAHSGGLNSEDCHNNRKTGDYHCHRAASNSAAPTPPPSVSSSPPRHLVPAEAGAALPPRSDGRPTCYVGPRGGTYTITGSGRKNYAGC